MNLKHVPTTCPYCGCGCGFYLKVKDGELAGVIPSKNHPVSQGRLCVKGITSWQSVIGADRIKEPLVRKNGEFKEASWDEALDLVAKKLTAIKEKHGPDSLGVWGSARCTNELNYLAQKLSRAVFAMHKLKKGDEIGIRGPYGNNFMMEEVKGRDFAFVAGGIGLAPLRSAIKYVMANRSDFGRIKILYGAKTKEDIVFAADMDKWAQTVDVEVHLTIDEPQEGWTGNTGVVTGLLGRIRGMFEHKCFVCGPPIMIHFTIKELLDAGWAEENIITTLERHMKCGVGKCGHCYIGDKYVCTDGPVFTYSQINAMEVEV